MQAADALAAPRPACAGKAYFITNAEPRPFWGFLGDLLEPLGYQRPIKKLPWRLIFLIAVLVELIIWLLKPFKVLIHKLTPREVYYSCQPCSCLDQAAAELCSLSLLASHAYQAINQATLTFLQARHSSSASPHHIFPPDQEIHAVQTIAASEFTPMRIRIAKANRQLDCSRARQDLGYAPKVAIDEALQRTVKHFSYLSAHGKGPS